MSGPTVTPAPLTIEANRKLIEGVDGRQERGLCWTQGKVRTLETQILELKGIVKELTQRLLDAEDDRGQLTEQVWKLQVPA